MSLRSVSLLVSGKMLLVTLVFSLVLAATAERVAVDWVDPFDVPDSEPSTRGMEPGEDLQYSSVSPKARQNFCPPKPLLTQRSQHICEIRKPQRQDGKKSRRAVLQDLAIRTHNSEVSWWWHLLEVYGVELDPSKKIGMIVFFGVVIRGTELWSKVFQFVKMSTLVTVCFFTSIIWNWAHLYKIAFAEHQKEMASLEGISEKCTGIKNIEWTDSLREWLRSAWTLQDGPCQQYYDNLFVNPILLVPPTKAISVTIVMFITEPLIGIGEGISGFFRALLKDLPFTFQFSVFILMALITVILVYGTVQRAFSRPAQGSPSATTGVTTTVSDPRSQGR